MLVLIRLYPKSGLNNLCAMIDSEKRNFYWRDVEPLYAIRQEGKRYISIVLDVKNIDAVKKVFLRSIGMMTSVRRTRTIPIMCPVYFPLPKGHPKGLDRFLVYLRVKPEDYKDVFEKIKHTRNTKEAFLTYMSYSFGDDDIVLSVLAKDREAATAYVKKKIETIEGVNAFDISKVVQNIRLLPKDRMKNHKDRFTSDAPAGRGGSLINKKGYERYLEEKATMTVFVRLYAKTGLAELWNEIEHGMCKFESEHVVPLYASQQENKSFITVIFESSNFEVLKDFLVNNVATMEHVRKTRTVPLVEPTYFLMPREHPSDLYRFFIPLRGDPSHYNSIRSKIIGTDFPDNVYLTYLSFSLGEDDLLLSILTESRKSAQNFATTLFDDMEGVRSYDISNQLKTMRLAPKLRWKQHQKRFMSSFDISHKEDFDTAYDWTDDFKTWAAMTGAFVGELDD